MLQLQLTNLSHRHGNVMLCILLKITKRRKLVQQCENGVDEPILKKHGNLNRYNLRSHTQRDRERDLA